jgi:DNA-binding transcriptional regulator YdaS (Cro superfamily)
MTNPVLALYLKGITNEQISRNLTIGRSTVYRILCRELRPWQAVMRTLIDYKKSSKRELDAHDHAYLAELKALNKTFNSKKNV